MFIKLNNNMYLNAIYIQDVGIYDEDDTVVAFKLTNGQKALEEHESSSDAQERVEEVKKLLTRTIDDAIEDGTKNLFETIEFDSQTFVMTFTTHGGSQIEIDLPCELLVEDGYYDTDEKAIVLVLVSGQKIYIPAAHIAPDIIGDKTLDDLITDDKTSIVGAVNEVKGETTILAADLTDLAARVTVNEGDISNIIGDITALQGRMDTAEGDISQLQRDLANVEAMHSFSEYQGIVSDNCTTLQMLNSIKALNLNAGTMLLGGCRLTDFPTGLGNAEVQVMVYPNNVLFAVLRSSNLAPYEWECNSHTFRGWEPVGNSIAITKANAAETNANAYTDAQIAATLGVVSSRVDGINGEVV